MSHSLHLILSPGTRIVTRNDVNRISGGQPIAIGAVAVITDSPTDAQHAYKVRFNDGAEAMLRRNEFSVLKEFKGEGIETTARGIDFEDWQPLIIYRCVVGSQAFGLSGDDSDVDRRGMYLPPPEHQFSLYGVPEQIENNDSQEACSPLKRGERPLPDANAWGVRVHKEFDEAFASKRAPERPHYGWSINF